MIRNLIANLNDQNNGAADLSSWCHDSEKENEHSRDVAQTSLDEAAAQILWAESALDQMKEEVDYFGAEISRLEKLAVDVSERKQAESVALVQQLSNHANYIVVLDGVVKVLKGECDIEDADLALVQKGRTRKHGRVSILSAGRSAAKSKQYLGTKEGQCTEAAKLVVQAIAKIRELSQAVTALKDAVTTQAEKEEQACENDYTQRQADHHAAQEAMSSRQQDLQTKIADKKKKEEDLKLIEQAAAAIAKKCTVRESRADRIASKQEEIEALQNALQVLNGEAIPVA